MMTVTYIWLTLFFLFASCSSDDSNPAISVEIALKSSTMPHYYREFDDPLGQGGSKRTLNLSGVTSFYTGDLHTYDGIKVPIFVGLAPGAHVDRVLFQVNGGTGTDPRPFMNNYNHKAVVMLSMRGLHHDDIKNHECALGSGLVDCLEDNSMLKKINPKDGGRDIVDVLNVILGKKGTLTVDGATKGHSFFGVDDETFNMLTASYGATMVAYALESSSLPEIGRIFIAGPSSPSENVITDGFRNARVAMGNLLDAIGLSDTEQDSFLGAMRARHNSFNTTCDASLNPTPTDDCLSSSMIWDYLKNEHERISEKVSAGSATSTALLALKNRLTDIPETEATGSSLANVIDIYSSDELNVGHRTKTTWESTALGLNTGSARKSTGFTSRIAHICSAYINRTNGDTKTDFDNAKANSDNDPYWYGFLMSYRDLLDICTAIGSNLKSGIEVPPASLNVAVEALLQYAAGTDEKHHMADVTEMASYIDNSESIVKSVYQDDAIQTGPAPTYKNCLKNIRSTFFENSLSNLELALDNRITSDCGISN